MWWRKFLKVWAVCYWNYHQPFVPTSPLVTSTPTPLQHLVQRSRFVWLRMQSVLSWRKRLSQIHHHQCREQTHLSQPWCCKVNQLKIILCASFKATDLRGKFYGTVRLSYPVISSICDVQCFCHQLDVPTFLSVSPVVSGSLHFPECLPTAHREWVWICWYHSKVGVHGPANSLKLWSSLYLQGGAHL